MIPGRRPTAIRALQMLARRLEFRAGVLEGVRMHGYDMAALELRTFSSHLVAAAARCEEKHRSELRGDRHQMAQHRVYMRYELLLGSWRVSFDALSARHIKLRDCTYADAGKIRDTAQRAGALPDLGAKQALDMGIRKGMGGLVLELNDEQFQRLRLPQNK